MLARRADTRSKAEPRKTVWHEQCTVPVQEQTTMNDIFLTFPGGKRVEAKVGNHHICFK